MNDFVTLYDEEGNEALEVEQSPFPGFVRLKVIDSVYRICDVKTLELMNALIKINIRKEKE